jgi:hypothetical protein
MKNKQSGYTITELMVVIVFLIIIVGGVGGYAQGVYKMVKCNWEPIGKAEVLYTVGTFTGLGAIIGWMDIEDK